MREPWLDQLEATVAESELAVALATVASMAGRAVELDEDELHGAARRALFVLAAGGDPGRGLDLKGAAVEGFAGEVSTPERRLELESGVRQLSEDALGLPHLSEITRALLAEPELAWRAYAASLLAEQLDED